MQFAILKSPTSARAEVEFEAVNASDLRRKFVSSGISAGVYVLAIEVGERRELALSRRRLYLTVKLPFIDSAAAVEVWELAQKTRSESVFVTEKIAEIAYFSAIPGGTRQ